MRPGSARAGAHRGLLRALLVALLGLGVGCSAFDRDASPLAPASDCPRVEEKLDGLLKLVAEERLTGLQQAISEDITADVRSRLVDLLLDVINALPEGTFSGLKPLVISGQADDLANPLADLLEAVVALGGTGYDGLAVGGKLLQQCTGRPLLVNLRTLLSDAVTRQHLEALLAGDGLDLGALLSDLGIDLTSLEGRAGLQALVRGLLTAISREDFQIDDLVGEEGLLSLLLDPNDETMAALTAVLQALLAPGEPLQSVQLVTSCLLEADADDRLVGLLFDLLADGALDGLLSGGASSGPELYGGGLGTIDQLLLPLLELLIVDEAARASAVITFSTLLQPDVARKVVPDLIVISREGVIGELLDLLSSLASGEC